MIATSYCSRLLPPLLKNQTDLVQKYEITQPIGKMIATINLINNSCITLTICLHCTQLLGHG